jgi:hypothetical protein
MADLTIEKATLKDGTLTVTGTGFTKTTTEVKVDNEIVDFELNDAGELTVEGVDVTAKKIKVKKGDVTKSKGITDPEDDDQPAQQSAEDEQPDYGDTDQSTTSEAEEPYKTATPDKTPGDLTKDDDATTSNVSEEDLATAANTGAADIARQSDVMREAMEPDRTNPQPGEHVPAKDFRFRVENTAAGDLNMDPREPYPTGNPPDPREEYYNINGFYPGEGGTGGIAGVKKTDKPNPEA